MCITAKPPFGLAEDARLRNGSRNPKRAQGAAPPRALSSASRRSPGSSQGAGSSVSNTAIRSTSLGYSPVSGCSSWRATELKRSTARRSGWRSVGVWAMPRTRAFFSSSSQEMACWAIDNQQTDPYTFSWSPPAASATASPTTPIFPGGGRWFSCHEPRHSRSAFCTVCASRGACASWQGQQRARSVPHLVVTRSPWPPMGRLWVLFAWDVAHEDVGRVKRTGGANQHASASFPGRWRRGRRDDRSRPRDFDHHRRCWCRAQRGRACDVLRSASGQSASRPP